MSGLPSFSRSRRAFRTLFTAPGAVVGTALVVLLALNALFAPLLFGDAASTYNVQNAMAGPSAQHWLGTDELGRDVLARVLVAGRLTLGLALLTVVLSTAAGIALGALFTVLGKRARRFMFQATSVATAFPAIVLAIFVGAVVGRGATAAVVGLSVAAVPATARVTMTLAASIGGSDFIAAARVIGVPPTRLLTRYVLPHVAEPLLTVTVLAAGGSLMALSALSFLGLGVQEPSYDWGRLLSGGVENVYGSPAYVLGPSAAIVIAGIAFSMLGGSLNVLLNPQRRRLLGGTRGPRTVRRAVPDSTAAPVEQAVLRIDDLWVQSRGATGVTDLVRGVSIAVAPGERLGIVGESGSGKTLTVSAMGCLLPESVTFDAARHEFDRRPIPQGRQVALRRELGSKIGMVFQDPMASLNPALTIRTQMMHKLRALGRRGRKQMHAEIIRALEDVRLPDPARLMRRRPHELSGGMQQRVMIAMALLGDPAIILADEATTALDATIQAEIIELLARINEERHAAIVLVSHDLALVSQVCERLIVMYAGQIIEQGPARQVIATPQHPYTRMLLDAVPDLERTRDAKLANIPGSPPNPASLPDGCPFAPRCPNAIARCTEQPPAMSGATDHQAACWVPVGTGPSELTRTEVLK